MRTENQKNLVMQQREEKNEMFATSDQILSSEERATFKGLKYFEYDAAYCVRATPTALQTPEKITLDFGSHGTLDLAKHSYIDFSVPTGNGRLYLYSRWEDSKPQEFGIPFKDKTNGTKTYGGGRNLEVSLETDGTILLDFNSTSNLFCAYNESFICAQPPQENWLTFPIPAGELTFK
jgi:uncharacterized protein (DUF1684 family)